MLAMVTGHRDELVEDPALVLLGRRPVAVSDRRQQFLFCHLTDASSHAIASPILGNILIEAMRRAGSPPAQGRHRPGPHPAGQPRFRHHQNLCRLHRRSGKPAQSPGTGEAGARNALPTLPAASSGAGIRQLPSQGAQVEHHPVVKKRAAGRTYTVPSRLIGKEVQIRLYADWVEVYFKGHPVECKDPEWKTTTLRIPTHPRSEGKPQGVQRPCPLRWPPPSQRSGCRRAGQTAQCPTPQSPQPTTGR